MIVLCYDLALPLGMFPSAGTTALLSEGCWASRSLLTICVLFLRTQRIFWSLLKESWLNIFLSEHIDKAWSEKTVAG